jgi:hypothetical protein
VCYLTISVLLYVHPPQTGSMFPNTLKFNLLTIQFTNVACNLTADNLPWYHVFYILSACGCHIGRFYLEWYMYLCGDDPVVFGSLILSCSLLHQTFAVLCPGSQD